MNYNEDMIEKYVIDLFKNNGYKHIEGINLDAKDVIMKDVLVECLCNINKIDKDIVERHYNEIFNFKSANLIDNNTEFSFRLKHGINFNDDGIAYHIDLIDTKNIDNNVFCVVDQYSIDGSVFTKRPDLIVYVNGIPIVLIELKNGFNGNIPLDNSYNQVTNYKNSIPDLFRYLQFNLLSNGIETKVGTLTSDFNRYAYFREEETKSFDIEFVIPELFGHSKLINVIMNYIEYSKENKIMLQYHQIRAIENFKSTYDGGFIWHTQGSGKSFTMAFMALEIMKHDPMARIVIVTDRNDLDTQLLSTFKTFKNTPLKESVRIERRDELEVELSKKHGSVTFMTIQKLEVEHGLVNDSSNIYIFTDEAHRSQYGYGVKFNIKKESIDVGFAQMLRDAFPNAKYIGFTGTPIETNSKSTNAVFGREIDRYDINQSVLDVSTVPIKYHQMAQNFVIDENMIGEIEAVMEEYRQKGMTEKQIDKEVRNLSKLTVLIGDKKRVETLVNTMLLDFDNNLKETGLKAMFVATNREIAVKIYNQIKRVRPEMCHKDINLGNVKVIMTGASDDKPSMAKHHTSKEQKELMAKRLKDKNDDLNLVIVVDMWLTGFDVPCVNTMYVDKIMKDHSLMQAITRVNRVFTGKEEGRIIDFIGIATNLTSALQIYSPSNEDNISIDVETKLEYLDKFNLLVEQCQMLTSGYNWREKLSEAQTPAQKCQLINEYVEVATGNKEVKVIINQLKNLKNLIIVDLTKKDKEKIAFLEASLSIMQTLESDDSNTIYDFKKKINDKLTSYFKNVENIEVIELLNITSNEVDIFNEDFLNALRQSPNINSNIGLLEKLLKIKLRSVTKKNMVRSASLLTKIREIVTKFQSNQIENTRALNQLLDICQNIQQEELNSNSGKSLLFDALYSIIEKYNNSILKDVSQKDIDNVIIEMEIEILNIVSEYIHWKDDDSLIARIKIFNKRKLINIIDPKKIAPINNMIIEQLKIFEGI